MSKNNSESVLLKLAKPLLNRKTDTSGEKNRTVQDRQEIGSLVSGHHILYSEITEDLYSTGLAVITTKEVHRNLLEWKPYGKRIITAIYSSVLHYICSDLLCTNRHMQMMMRKSPFMRAYTRS